MASSRQKNRNIPPCRDSTVTDGKHRNQNGPTTVNVHDLISNI